MQNKSTGHPWRGRRGFLQWLALGFGSVAGLLPAAVQHRFARVVAQTSADQADKKFIKVATVKDLAKGPFKVENAFGKNTPTLWLSGDPKDENSLLALDATCPHEGCDVDWRGENYVCPCHGAAFAADGSRIRGPANADLTAYEVKVENGEILVAEPQFSPGIGRTTKVRGYQYEYEDEDEDEYEDED